MTHPDSPEFLAILERVPRWHMLTPDDKIQDGDYKIEAGNVGQGQELFMDKIHWAENTGDLPFVFRPIPEHVRRSEAWFQLLSDVCREHSGNPDYSTVLYACIQQGATISGIFSPDLAKKLGTDDECEKFIEEGPGAYMRWVLGV